ncbi:MAG: hypothetical protein ACYDHN_12135 [Solirubrobacteraceae bacterium]
MPDLPLGDTWTLPSGETGGIDKAFTWLERRQVRGRWEDNIWDTAGAIRAAALHNRLSSAYIHTAITWLDRQSANDWGLKSGLPPHYAAQALLAYNDAGYNDNHAILIELLLSYLKDNEDLAQRSLYIAAQVAEALIECGVSPAELQMRGFADTLSSRLGQIEVSSANFLDIACGFLAVGVINGGVDERSPDAQLTLANMLKPSRLRSNGSWYQNVLFTSWALVALSRVARVITLEAIPLEVYTLLANVRDEIATEADARLGAGYYAAGFAIALGALLASAVWVVVGAIAGPLKIETRSNALWWVMGLIVTLSVISFRLMLGYTRRRIDKGE